MDQQKKLNLLEVYKEELTKFKTNLNSDNLIEFKKLLDKIEPLLNENQKIRFKRLDFYSSDASNFLFSNEDDLPF